MHFPKNILCVIALAMLSSGAVTAQEIIPTGFDVYVHQDSTCWDFSSQPLPADYFGPGSDPFDGIICFAGRPLGPVPQCPSELAWGNMLLERMEPAFLPSIGAIDTVDVQIVALDLVSTDPITVTYNGGLNPELWEVEMTISESVPSAGMYALTRTHENGGMFYSEMSVSPKFTFTRISDMQTQVLDGAGIYDDYLTPDPGSDPDYMFPFGSGGEWLCESCDSEFIPGHNGTEKQILSMSGVMFQQDVTNACQQIPPFPPGPDDDVTTSLGSMRLWVLPVYRPLLTGCPGWDDDARWQSAVLYDPDVIIGRSDVHTDDDPIDISGAVVGLRGVVISDSDFALRPSGFEGPAGTNEVHTEIVEMALTGAGSFTVRCGNDAPSRPMSPGEIETKIPTGPDFPAESFFDVYVEVDLPGCGSGFLGGTVYHHYPLLTMNDNLEYPPGFPPEGLYVHGNSTAMPLYFLEDDPGGAWVAGDLFGYIVQFGLGMSLENTPEDIALFSSLMAGVPEMPYQGTGLDDLLPRLTYYLDINYPNPFNPVTMIHYGIEKPAHVTLRIYDVSGRLVRTLVDETQMPHADGYTVKWDGTDNRGASVASGVYFYKFAANNFVKARKMVLLE